jgi:hypothetical protein
MVKNGKFVKTGRARFWAEHIDNGVLCQRSFLNLSSRGAGLARHADLSSLISLGLLADCWKTFRSPSTGLRARPEFTEGTTGGDFISSMILPTCLSKHFQTASPLSSTLKHPIKRKHSWLKVTFNETLSNPRTHRDGFLEEKKLPYPPSFPNHSLGVGIARPSFVYATRIRASSLS